MTWNGFTLLLVQGLLLSTVMTTLLARTASAYDPGDKSLKDILLPEGQFEAFYLKGSQEEEQNAVRPAHLHGSFHQFRNPALINAPNSAAYGFRFDGKRRFNYE
ncbi:uncharacterized protein LOC144473166 [Augochlora pura]